MPKNFDESVYTEDRSVDKVNISDLNTENMKIYGANINLARVFPEIHDGLKLVERRILYAMYTMTDAYKDFEKSAAVEGDCMKIHPHGGAYPTMVRLAQPWNMVIPYITGKGNFGSVNGDAAGANRYTEVKLSPYALDCFFTDWDPELITMIDSYNHKYKEPVYLPTKYPNCLLSSADGLGFGLATHVPTFNIQEILNATIELIRDPKYDVVLIPDMTTGCLVVDEGNFPEICRTGEGNFKMRGEITKNEKHHSLVVTSVPFQVSLNSVKDKIQELVENKVINGFKDMHEDVIDKKQIFLEVFFKPEVDLDNIISVLYAKADLQQTYPVQMKMVDNFTIVNFSVKSALQRWVDIRMEFKERKFTKKMVDLEARNYILSILIKMLDGKNAEKTIELIRHSTKDDVIKTLIKEYNISSVQAKEIANMKLSAFNKTAREEYLKEYPENETMLKKYSQILDNPENIKALIIEELKDGIKKYSQPRRSKVVKLKTIAKYSDYETNLVFTENGYVKKIDGSKKGLGNFGTDDNPISVVHVNNRDEVVIFDKRGSVHTVEVGKITQDSFRSIGEPLSMYVSITGKPVAAFSRQDIKDDTNFIFITKRGIIKKTSADNFAFKNSILGITLKPDDELVSVIISKHKDNDILVYSKYGFVTRFNTAEIPMTKRMAIGVIGFPVAKNDAVIGVKEIGPKDNYILIITNKGFVKKCTLEVLSTQKRRSEPVSVIAMKDSDSINTMISCKGTEVFSVASQKDYLEEYLHVAEIPEALKFGTGTKLIPVKRGDKILKVF